MTSFRMSAIVLGILVSPALSFADDAFSTSGRLNLRGVDTLNSDSVREDPGIDGRIKFDIGGSAWKLHSWLEGGRDGAVRKPVRYHSLFKSYDRVYQNYPEYAEFKELYAQYLSGALDLRLGIQRFAWGRLDEFPPNDLLNPWDFTQFLRKPLEDRKIGVPAISASLAKSEWSWDAVWVPVFVPYRLPLPYERWSGISTAAALELVPNADIVPSEPDLPERTIGNGSAGIRIRHPGDIEWALNLFNGYDTRPVFRTTALVIQPQAGSIRIDPGYVPDFHRITSVGLDAAAVRGDWSIRAEAAYITGRYYTIRRELWGYPSAIAPGVFPLNSIGLRTDVLDYGIGADYRLFEDGTLVMQAQQTMIRDRPHTLYERKFETILWASLKAGFLNQKVETTTSIAWNPEHGATMGKANAWYVFTDAWKAGITAIDLNGPPQSVFGRYSRNDQVEAEIAYAW